MKWTIAQARQRLSALLKAADEQPQLICRRNQPVAVVVNVSTFEAFAEWREKQSTGTIADAFAELRALCQEQGYELTLPQRTDRPNAFAEAEHGASG